MDLLDLFLVWTAELLPFFSALGAFIYGIVNFFKKGVPLHLQSITLAMGCHALGSLYHICLSLTNTNLFNGFTPTYLGRIGFFLFFLTASYGQLDRIVDDRSRALRPSRYIALIAPILAILLFIPNATVDDVPASTKITYLLVWIPAIISVYYNMKHAIIPDLDFGFIKAVKSFNILATLLGFSELIYLTAWMYYSFIPMVISALVFSVFCISTMIAAKRGVEKWTI